MPKDDRPSSNSNRYEEENSRSKQRPSWENSAVRRHVEKINQNKLLWSSKNKDANAESTFSPSTSDAKQKDTWTSMFAASNADSQKISKFQRLMGIKKTGDVVESTANAIDADAVVSPLNSDSVAKEKRRQQELTKELDRQYTLARATTHLGRGRGFGFQ